MSTTPAGCIAGLKVKSRNKTQNLLQKTYVIAQASFQLSALKSFTTTLHFSSVMMPPAARARHELDSAWKVFLEPHY